MNKIYKLLMVGMIGVSLFGCASMDRWGTDIKSDLNGGYVKFDYDGKRYVYYNCFVETIADK